MSKIDFSMKNIKKCLCTKCPVQINSQCVIDKQKMMLLITQQDLDSPMRIDPDRVPGLYCSIGKALCKDIITEKVCKCAECDIWKENKLELGKTHKYFCVNGKERYSWI